MSSLFSGNKRIRSKRQDALWNQTYEPLVRHMLGPKEGIRLKQAVEVGRKAVDYFRGSDFLKWVSRHEKALLNKFPESFPGTASGSVISKESVLALGESLILHGFIYKVANKPILTAQSKNKSSSTNYSSASSKWPKRVEACQEQTFLDDANAFYAIRYEMSDTWSYLLLCLVALAVLVICLFPAWPLPLKLGIWHLSVYFSSAMIGLVVLRLLLFSFLWFFGVNYWLFPNIFNEELGVLDSFRPVHFWEKRNDSKGMFVLRIVFSVALAGAIYHLKQAHNIQDVHRFAKRQFLDILEWGHQKLAPSNMTSSAVTLNTVTGKLESHRKKEKFCMSPCGFADFGLLNEECLFDCGCVEEVLQSHCLKNCPADLKAELLNKKELVCGPQ